MLAGELVRCPLALAQRVPLSAGWTFLLGIRLVSGVLRAFTSEPPGSNTGHGHGHGWEQTLALNTVRVWDTTKCREEPGGLWRLRDWVC